jgi:methylthioribose-1-phosphate isomerase
MRIADLIGQAPQSFESHPADPQSAIRNPQSAFRNCRPRARLALMSIQAIAWSPSGAVRIVDQRALPEARIERDLESAEAVADAIRTLQVRGAPLIGIAAAMGLVAGMRELRSASREEFLGRLGRLTELLAAARPTAVNLRWALERMARRAIATPGDGVALWERLHAEATAIWEEDRAMCRRIGEAGLPLVPDGATVLTHCNAGALATGGIGTALAPIYLAHEAGRRLHVFVDETRPVLQGARLTAWELSHAGIPCTLIADAAAGSLMRQAKFDLVIVGADRIAANGDFANKIGTYPLAVLALHHGVPFYCAAPSSTIDAALRDGDGIPIEQRSPDEVKTVAGRPVAPAAVGALNPAFDVTPARYVTGYLTDRGLRKPPFGAD